jgi:hypothetical protein
MQQEPNFLVEDSDGRLHGYMRPDILRVDLATNRHDPPRRIFRLDQTSLTITYNPVDINELLLAIPADATTTDVIATHREPLRLKA